MAKVEVDSHKLMYHPERVAQWLKNGDCFPIYVEVGPTNRCNHRCKFCALNWMKKEGIDMDYSVLKTNLEDMAKHGVKSVMFAGEGEPLLHKDVPRAVQHAKQLGLGISITTNGSPLTKRVAEQIIPSLSWIRFSLDAATPKTYEKIHQVQKECFVQVCENIRYAVEVKDKTSSQTNIAVQAIIMEQNLDEMVQIASLAKQLGVDNVQLKPYSHHPQSKNEISADFERAAELRGLLHMLETTKFKVFYRDQAIRRLQDGKDYNECHGLPFFALIDAKGNVIPCNLYYNNPEFTYGNINKKVFSEIWQGDKRKEVIKKIKDRGISQCRESCRLDCINHYLDRLRFPEPGDIFI